MVQEQIWNKSYTYSQQRDNILMKLDLKNGDS